MTVVGRIIVRPIEGYCYKVFILLAVNHWTLAFNRRFILAMEKKREVANVVKLLHQIVVPPGVDQKHQQHQVSKKKKKKKSNSKVQKYNCTF